MRSYIATAGTLIEETETQRARRMLHAQRTIAKETRMPNYRLRSKYWSNHHGAGRITVYGAGHQLTVPYDHAASDPHADAVNAFTLRYLPTANVRYELARNMRGAFPHVRYWKITDTAKETNR